MNQRLYRARENWLTAFTAGIAFITAVLALCYFVKQERARRWRCACGNVEFKQQVDIEMDGELTCTGVSLKFLDGSKMPFECKRLQF